MMKIWLGAAVVVALYLALCGVIESHEARIERCSVVRCT